MKKICFSRVFKGEAKLIFLSAAWFVWLMITLTILGHFFRSQHGFLISAIITGSWIDKIFLIFAGAIVVTAPILIILTLFYTLAGNLLRFLNEIFTRIRSRIYFGKKVLADVDKQEIVKEALKELNLDLGQAETFTEICQPIHCRKGTVICKSNTLAKFFYFIERGQVSVERALIDGSNLSIMSLGRGQFFGEEVVEEGTYRFDYVSNGALLLQIKFSQEIADYLPEDFVKRVKLVRTLKKAPAFSHISGPLFFELIKMFQFEKVKKSRLLIKEGESGDKFYIISSGVFIVEKAGTGRIAQLQVGDFFGEIALLTDKPRTSSVIAKEDAEVMVLNREDFLSVLSKDIGSAIKLETEAELRLDEQKVLVGS